MVVNRICRRRQEKCRQIQGAIGMLPLILVAAALSGQPLQATGVRGSGDSVVVVTDKQAAVTVRCVQVSSSYDDSMTV